jgi:hypothetical protein
MVAPMHQTMAAGREVMALALLLSVRPPDVRPIASAADGRPGGTCWYEGEGPRTSRPSLPLPNTANPEFPTATPSVLDLGRWSQVRPLT